ncbi:hypothetical protein VKT23_002989 [Stygiomarasmius scandens]|uniref:Uncharacterized protein n=1 Tax=Marasmiellus scandens TaxID=2682957 RepID=A0ABR1JVV5_9AGAR
MSTNPYPSPVSSPSPNFDPSILRSDVQSPAPNTSVVPLVPSEADRSELPTASSRQDAALQRIRQLRRSLVEVNQDAANSFSPGHEAILLTGHSEDRLEQAAWNRLNAILPASTMERLRRFENTTRRESDRVHQLLRITAALDTTSTYSNVSPSSPHPTSSSQSPSLLTSPLSPPRQRLLPPRTLQDPSLLRSREMSDDPHTLLGRRVAAREASGSSNASDHHITEQDFEYIRNLARQRRSEPAFQRRIESSLDAMRREALEAHSRSLDNAVHPVSAGAPIRGHMRRALRTSRIDSRQPSSSNTSAVQSPRERLSILSNFSSVQNLPTPSSTTSSQRIILFEEPTSYTSLEESRMASVVTSEVQGRSYVTTRRLNAEGDEYVHTIDGPLGEEITFTSPFTSSPVQMHPPDTILPPGLSGENPRDHRRDNTAQASDYVIPASTFFGTIYDRDGNEISPEEQPLLRPYETQVQPPFSVQWLPESVPAPLRIPDPLDTVTLTPVIPNAPHSPPRVRINPREPELAEDSREPSVQWIGSNKPLFIDPLPMPIESMISSEPKPKKQSPRGKIKVSRYANFAGR